MTATLHPFVYEMDLSRIRDRRIVEFAMPPRIYAALKEVQGITGEKNSANLGGLAAVLGWSATAVDLLKVDFHKGSRQKTLCLWMIDPVKPMEALRKEVEAALAIWLGLILPGRAESVIRMLADMDPTSAWTEICVDPTTNQLGACPIPADNRLFDLLTLFAARALENRPMNVGTVDEGLLISSGPQKSLYAGKKMLRSPPTMVEKRKGLGWWTEVFSVAALSTPERDNLRVAVNISIRNFADIDEKGLSWSRSRNLDIFLPADPLLAGGSSRTRCVSLETSREDWINAVQERPNEHDYERRVLKSLLEMAGVQLAEADLGLKHIITDTISVFPRFGTVHGDKWAPGGTGVAHPERREYLAFLDQYLGESGFERITLSKISKRGSKSIPIKVNGQTPASLREATLRSLDQVSPARRLDFVHYQGRAASDVMIRDALTAVFGAPDSEEGGQWRYPEGLELALSHRQSGPLAELLPAIDESSLSSIPASARSRARKALLADRDSEAKTQMMSFLGEENEKGSKPWLAFVEMPAGVKKEGKRDPYLLTYQAIASKGGVAQVRLFDPTLNLDHKPDPDSEADLLKKQAVERIVYENAILDLLRSAGVSPIQGSGMRLCAWWVIDRNGSQEWQAGERPAICTPVHVEWEDGRILVYLLDRNERVVKCSYSEAISLLEGSATANLLQYKGHERAAKIGQFFAATTRKDGVRTLVLAAATNIRLYVPGLGNGRAFGFDSLQLGEIGGAAPAMTITSADEISIIRINDESAKAPCYWVEGNTQGTTSGIFQEPGSERTFWVSRGLSTALHLGSNHANQTSRHLAEGPRYMPRRFPTLSEVCVVVRGRQENILDLMTMTRTLMSAHIATEERTILPFPLHEAELLGGATK